MESSHARRARSPQKEQNMRAHVTTIRQKGDWIQVGLHGSIIQNICFERYKARLIARGIIKSMVLIMTRPLHLWTQ
jgi:hypothetical protein